MSLRPAVVAIESKIRAEEFLTIARLLAAAKGDLPTAEFIAKDTGAPQRVQAVLRSAVAAGSMSDPTWAAPLAEYQTGVAAFFESLRNVGIFDRMLGDGAIRRVPLNTRGAVVTGAVTGDTPAESKVRVLSSMAFDSKTVAPRNSMAIVVTSSTLLRHAAPGSIELFNNELRNAVAAATDRTFLAALYAATTPTASAGSSLANIVTDLGELLTDVVSDRNSRFYFVIDSTNAKKLALKTNSIGAPAFPSFGPAGGMLMPGVMGLVSDDLPSGAALLIDAAQLMGNSETITLDVATNSTLQFETAPDSPPTASTTLRNLWQHGEIGLTADRWWGFGLARTTAVAALSGVSY